MVKNAAQGCRLRWWGFTRRNDGVPVGVCVVWHVCRRGMCARWHEQRQRATQRRPRGRRTSTIPAEERTLVLGAQDVWGALAHDVQLQDEGAPSAPARHGRWLPKAQPDAAKGYEKGATWAKIRE